MVHTTQHTPQHIARAQPTAPMAAALGQEVASPETGEFDFFGYLMGLQASPTDNMQGDSSGLDLLVGAKAQAKTSSKDQDADQPLLSLFDKKNESLSWNPLFPNGLQATALENKQASEALSSADGFSNRMEGAGKNRGAVEKAEVKGPAPLDLAVMALKVQGLKDEQNSKMGVQKQSDETQNLAVQKAQRDFGISQYVPKETKVAGTENVQANSVQQTQNPMAHEQAKLESKADVSSSKKHGKESDEVFLVAGNSQAQGTMHTAPVIATEGKGEVRHSIPEVMQKVESMVHNGGGKMTVQLNPPSLGRVTVEVTARGKNVEIQMKSENALAKATLESHMTDLKQSMQTQDLNLHKMEVHINRDWDSSMTSQSGQQFSQFASHQGPEQGSRGNSQDSKEAPWKNPQSTNPQQVKVAPAVISRGRTSHTDGRVDIRI